MYDLPLYCHLDSCHNRLGKSGAKQLNGSKLAKLIISAIFLTDDRIEQAGFSDISEMVLKSPPARFCDPSETNRNNQVCQFLLLNPVGPVILYCVNRSKVCLRYGDSERYNFVLRKTCANRLVSECTVREYYLEIP